MWGQQLSRPSGKAVTEEYGNIANRLPRRCILHMQLALINACRLQPCTFMWSICLHQLIEISRYSGNNMHVLCTYCMLKFMSWGLPLLRPSPAGTSQASANIHICWFTSRHIHNLGIYVHMRNSSCHRCTSCMFSLTTDISIIQVRIHSILLSSCHKIFPIRSKLIFIPRRLLN